jgi:HAD superfamily hydrolase (TIGR01509 family)
MYKAVVFDFFGVIRGDAYEAWLDGRGLKRKGTFLDTVRALDQGFISLEDFLDALSSETGEEPDVILKEINRGATINEHVIGLIQELRGTYDIGLLTNASAAFIAPLLADHDLTALFDHVVVSGEVGYAKPDAEIFEVALERMGVVASEVVFIDDNQDNVDAAVALGITGLLFSGVTQLRQDLAQLNL